MKATLAGEHLAKTYGARQVVRDVNIEITQGEIVGLRRQNNYLLHADRNHKSHPRQNIV